MPKPIRSRLRLKVQPARACAASSPSSTRPWSRHRWSARCCATAGCRHRHRHSREAHPESTSMPRRRQRCWPRGRHTTASSTSPSRVITCSPTVPNTSSAGTPPSVSASPEEPPRDKTHHAAHRATGCIRIERKPAGARWSRRIERRPHPGTPHGPPGSLARVRRQTPVQSASHTTRTRAGGTAHCASDYVRL